MYLNETLSVDELARKFDLTVIEYQTLEWLLLTNDHLSMRESMSIVSLFRKIEKL